MKKTDVRPQLIAVIIAFVVMVFVAYSYEQHLDQKDRQIESLKQITIDQQHDYQELLKELNKTKEQLFISNDVLKQIEMRNEGINYQEESE